MLTFCGIRVAFPASLARIEEAAQQLQGTGSCTIFQWSFRDIRGDLRIEGSIMENSFRGFGASLAAFAVAILSGGRVSAETIELTSVGSSGTINGALFQQASPQ